MTGDQSPWLCNVVPLHHPLRLSVSFLNDCKQHPFVAIILNDDGGVSRVYEKDVTPEQRRTIQALLATMEDTDG